ncbi:MAG TPA: hypothetical protein VFJ82_02260 [Longimicrobium sp.]|nr:hypothetical protein [Longimicrobium sp.]
MIRHIDTLFPMHGTGRPIAIRCPRCGAEASLADAYTRESGERARAAAADPNVTGVWVHSQYFVIHAPRLLSWDEISTHHERGEVWGICRCGACGHADKHRLSWPADAYYTASIRGRTLWAWTREHVVALRAFVAREKRDRRALDGLPYGIARYVKRVPSEILFARNRAEVLKKLDRLLAGGPEPRAVASRPDPWAKPVIR